MFILSYRKYQVGPRQVYPLPVQRFPILLALNSPLRRLNE